VGNTRCSTGQVRLSGVAFVFYPGCSVSNLGRDTDDADFVPPKNRGSISDEADPSVLLLRCYPCVRGTASLTAGPQEQAVARLQCP
jgi:hypothetical protein